MHTHSILTVIFQGEPGLASCPLNSPSPFITGLCSVHPFGIGYNGPKGMELAPNPHYSGSGGS